MKSVEVSWCFSLPHTGTGWGLIDRGTESQTKHKSVGSEAQSETRNPASQLTSRERKPQFGISECQDVRWGTHGNNPQRCQALTTHVYSYTSLSPARTQTGGGPRMKQLRLTPGLLDGFASAAGMC